MIHKDTHTNILSPEDSEVDTVLKFYRELERSPTNFFFRNDHDSKRKKKWSHIDPK